MTLLNKIKSSIKDIINYDDYIRIQWIKKSKDSSLFHLYPDKTYKPNHLKIYDQIEENVKSTGEMGNLPLWEGYDQLKNYKINDKKQRNVYQVRSAATICKFYTELVTKIKPRTIVEIGGAFGVSGMYWLAGIKINNLGILYSFEPNQIWAAIAKNNLISIDQRFELINATFEGKYKTVFDDNDSFNLAFIDAIHTSEFVYTQYEILREYAEKGAIILFDDIHFSENMKQCWQEIANKKEVKSSFQVSNRVGVIELL